MRLFKHTSKAFLTSILALTLVVGVVHESEAQGKRKSITGNRFKSRGKGQKRRMPKNYLNAVKFVGGTSLVSYYGDLCTNADCFRFRPGIDAGVMYRYNEHFAFRTHAMLFRMYGTDEGGLNSTRNLHFRSTNLEFVIGATYDIFTYNKMFRRRHPFIPYVSLGVGALVYTPKAELDGTWYNLRKLETEGFRYGSLTFVIPYGGGVRMKLTPVLDVSFEIGYRTAFSDYLDDVSTTYPSDLSTGNYDEITVALSDRRNELNEKPQDFKYENNIRRGNPDRNDGYIMYGLKAEYTLKVTRQHYNVKRNTSRLRVVKSVRKRR